ncbi:MAG: NAD(P)-dependent oxidoreductase [Fuerstiella sp.]|jgi:nucleoside-diphosphate-sugar epimerase|nr:NAD(P)-dependent oxidoreductase [Fuerstiella sp.]MCP4512496.1 NAD(P)-dependent oxidoreductase [Fuerstiella sp.]MDG2129887.1 NAD(P)-dependent oxidoreductase [Fuerstiella sp.]
MKVAITGATGFVGRYIVRKMHDVGNSCRCWFRSEDNCYEAPTSADTLEWTHGELGNQAACDDLLTGCDAVVHSGLHRTGEQFRGGEGDVAAFVQKNVVGTIQLIEAARRAGVRKFVFISTCAVHEKILDDRPLDESHPLWMTTHYGAHKAAVEQFVHSYGFGVGFPICALRPTGVYGRHHEPHRSKWFELVKRVANGNAFECRGGGKEVHAADVAEAVDILLHSNDNAGEVYSCYDRYVSQYDIAVIARELSGSDVEIPGKSAVPRHQIVSDKIKGLGMQFGGESLLKQTIQELIDASR